MGPRGLGLPFLVIGINFPEGQSLDNFLAQGEFDLFGSAVPIAIPVPVSLSPAGVLIPVSLSVLIVTVLSASVSIAVLIAIT